MSKKNLFKKRTKVFTKERLILWSIIATLAISQAISAWYLIKMWDYTSQREKRNFAAYINESEQKRYEHPVIDISEGRVYIPEARLYVPLNDVTRNLRYEYRTIGDTTSLFISSSSAVGQQSEKYDHACDKVVSLLQINRGGAIGTNISSELPPNKDSFRYMYAHDAITCPSGYDDFRQDLIDAVKTMQQY